MPFKGKRQVKNSSSGFPRKIRYRLIFMFLIPTGLLAIALGWYFMQLAERSLEKEMGLRLRGLAGSAVEAISGEAVTSFSSGDETGRAYLNSRERVRRLLELGAAARIYVFDKERNSLLDTREDVSIGKRYHRLDADRFEIDQVFSNAVTASSTMFTGIDGKLYKSGYAPIVQNDKIVAVVGVEAGVQFFGMLRQLRNNLIVFSIIGVMAIIVVGIFAAKGIEQPIGRLVESAQRIGTGDLDTEIKPTTRDEIGFLAHRLNEMRKNMVERDRYLQMLQRGIAHEVRNPLGGMELFCDILSEELGDDEGKKAHVGKILREIESLKKVVNDFLDFTKEVTPDKRDVDLKTLVSEVMFHYATFAQNDRIRLNTEVDDSLGNADLDPELVRAALFNLINNGIQAMPEGGILTVSASKIKDRICISVRDTGQGIAGQDIEQIFTPFFTTKDKGTGLGLALVKKIVEIHNGEIEVESSPEQGTEFMLKFPASEKT
jgi:signal transduction histidine kinase